MMRPEIPDRKRIGIDFDNTIVSYDRVLVTAAAERGLLPAGFRGDKQAVRDAIRLLPDGERCWQQLQGFVYGSGIVGAAMFVGVDAFLRRCRLAGHEVFIVSHKTVHGHFDPARVDLREAALGWMARNGILGAERDGVPVEHVHFESTRSDKVRRVARLGCTLFIDDLAEVLDDPEFPPIERILFSTRQVAPSHHRYRVCGSWAQIEAQVFREGEVFRDHAP